VPYDFFIKILNGKEFITFSRVKKEQSGDIGEQHFFALNGNINLTVP
jgi:hypothetical protein